MSLVSTTTSQPLGLLIGNWFCPCWYLSLRQFDIDEYLKRNVERKEEVETISIVLLLVWTKTKLLYGIMDGQVHPETLEETVPPVLEEVYYSGTSLIERYGWYLLGGALLLWYSWTKLRDVLYRWQAEKEEKEFAAMCHKDPDLIRQRQEALELARLKMQEDYKKKAEIAAERRKQREEQKKQENLERHKVVLGTQLNEENDDTVTKRSKPSSNTRQEYNPLMGSGGSGGYRPPRRSCPGGGCG